MRATLGTLLLVAALSTARAAGAAPEPASSCPPLAGAEPVLRAGVVVLLGEIHGTEESPRAAAEWLCRALARGLPVSLGLEIPRGEQARLDGFLASDGGVAARAELLASSFWTRSYQDGRSSRAMAALLESARGWLRAGADLRVLALDADEPTGERDLTMATRLAENVGGARFAVALAGNWHTRLVVGAPWDERYRPLGERLREAAPGSEIVSLNLVHTGGSAWICTSAAESDCGERRLSGDGGATGAIEWASDRAAAPYSGRQSLGEIHASPPAVTRAD